MAINPEAEKKMNLLLEAHKAVADMDAQVFEVVAEIAMDNEMEKLKAMLVPLWLVDKIIAELPADSMQRKTLEYIRPKL